MACIHAFSQKAPVASRLIYWGAISFYGDLVAMRDDLDRLLPKLARVIHQLKQFTIEIRDLACLAYTHEQAAQPTTVIYCFQL
jgi:adenylosuccinate lyase